MNKIQKVQSHVIPQLTVQYLDKFKSDMKSNMDKQLQNQIRSFEFSEHKIIDYINVHLFMRDMDAKFTNITE